MTGIVIDHVVKRFGAVTALDDVRLDVADGEFLTVLGPSGSGKSTLLEIIAGLQDPSSGSIHIDDADITALGPEHRNIGLVFQNYSLFPTMDVFGNVAFPLRVRKRDKGTVADRVAWAMNLVRLRGYEKRKVSELSGGQQQRVALARALIFDPSVLLLDEPLAALDRKLRQEVQVELRELQREVGVTTIMVTHDQEEALALSDRIAIVNDGMLEQVGTPMELYTQPATPFVADFFGSANLIEGVAQLDDGDWSVRSGSSRFPCGPLAVDAGTTITLSLRPECISVHESGSAGHLEGVIREAIYLGTGIRYHVTLEDQREIVAYSTGNSAPHPVAGRVSLNWRKEDVWPISQP